jgi:hypothetical protein
MTALVRLYPRAWRERYEAEFLGILQARPPSRRDRLDIVRGALDARLHPEIPGRPDAPGHPTQTAGWVAVSSILAGVVFLAWVGLILRDFRGWDGGQPETSGAMFVLSGLAALLLAATHVLLAVAGQPSMRTFGNVGASVAAASFVLTAVGGGPSLLFAIAGSVILAVAMAGRTVPVWLSVLWIAASVVLVATMLGFVGGGGMAVGLLPWLAPFGLSWLLIGLTVARSGVPARPIATTES